MVGGTRIIAFGSGGQEAAGDEILLTEEVVEPPVETGEVSIEEEAPLARRRDWLLPALALAVVALWTGFFAWANQDEFAAGIGPGGWTRLVTDWAMPVLLVAVIWLIFMRSGRREAMRFGDTARVLSNESARLEARLLTINRELSLAREFIAAQARDLDALGRIATERLSENADRLQGLIHDNGARIDSIGTVSEAALDNMEKLRGQLPVIASSAKDVTNNIGNAGRAAAMQLGEMIEGFKRLNDFGQASERQVDGLQSKIDAALSELLRQSEQLDQIATSRFTGMAQRGAEFRGQLETQEAEALAAIRTRAAALTDEVAQTRLDLDTQVGSPGTELEFAL